MFDFRPICIHYPYVQRLFHLIVHSHIKRYVNVHYNNTIMPLSNREIVSRIQRGTLPLR